MQLQFTINSETITFSMFLPRLADPVPSCCSSPYSTLSCSAGERWCLILCTSCPVTWKSCGNETFLCDDIKLNTYLDIQFAVIYEKILPWWVSKLRNVGEIPQLTCHILENIIYLSFKMNALDDAFFSGISFLSIDLNCLLIWMFQFRGVLNSIWSFAHIRFCWICIVLRAVVHFGMGTLLV